MQQAGKLLARKAPSAGHPSVCAGNHVAHNVTESKHPEFFEEPALSATFKQVASTTSSTVDINCNALYLEEEYAQELVVKRVPTGYL